MYPFISCLPPLPDVPEDCVHLRPLETRLASPWLPPVAIALAAVLLLAPVAAAQEETSEPVEQQVTVDVGQRDASVDPEGSFRFAVAVTVAAPTEYLESRVRILNPSGRLMYQKTEIRHDLDPGRVTILYERELADLGLPEGRYPVEVRVLASGADPTIVEDRMLVVSESREPLDVALVVRLSCSPGRNPEGRFVESPQAEDPLRDQALAAAQAASSEHPLALAIPPVILEDWMVASMGFEAVGPSGVESVPDDDPAAIASAEALEQLGALAATDDLTLLDVPYAEPDLAGLQAMNAIEDLTEHYRQGRTVYQASLGITPADGTAIAGDSFPADAAPVLTSRGFRFALLDSAAFTSSTVTVTTGSYDLVEGPTALIIDARASAAMGDPDAFVERLFEVATDEERPLLVAQVEIGPGSHEDARDLDVILDAIDELPWVRLVSSDDAAASTGTDQLELPSQAAQGAPAPLGYWGEVLEARRLAYALRSAAGASDRDAQNVTRQLLLAESRCWAGPDEGWGLADRGRAYAAAAARGSEAVLAAITVSSVDITLAGRSGEVPLSITNGSDKRLVVTVHASGDHARVGPPDEFEVTLSPADNFLKLPVSMTAAVSDRLKVEVEAGDTIITTTYVDVRTSYLDRLVLAGTVVLVLAGLLFYIRRRVMS